MEEKKTFVTLYTDGACSGNPGAGGYGAILVHVDANGIKHEKEFSEGFVHTTNNQMELLAVIIGLEALKKPCKVKIISDSKYVVDSIEKGWLNNWVAKDWKKAGNKPVPNAELWKRLIEAKKNHEIELEWIKGHAGHEYNERCDKLAVAAYKKSNLKSEVF